MFLSRNPRLASERSMRAMHKLVEGLEDASVEELNRALQRARESGELERLTKAVPTDAVELAHYLCCEADAEPSPQRRGQLLSKALRLDPECVTAGLMQLEGQRLSYERRLERLRQLVALAERQLGAEGFEEYRGHFWAELKTRPYMRARRQLALELAWDGRREGAEHLRGLLELCPGDNLGVRDDLLVWYLEHREGREALELIGHYPNDASLVFVWGAGLALAQTGQMEAATARFRELFGEWPELAAIFADADELQAMVNEFAGERPPDEYSVGSRSEIEYAFTQLGRATVETEAVIEPIIRGLEAFMAPQGRNERCGCGSGKKFKNCCGRPQ